MNTPLRTVRQAVAAFADEQSAPVAEVISALLNDHLEPSLPPRYRHLAADVVLRLPEGWDSHAHWTMCAGDISATHDVHQAGVRLLEQERGDLQLWEVRLVPAALDGYSDAAIQWVIAHELAHVSSGLPTDKHQRDDVLCEDRADHLATLWGFQPERAAYEAERAPAR